YAQAFPGAYTISKLDTAPCTITCPANVNACGYVSLVSQGRFQEAMDVIMDVLPLPGTLGRICPHPCEANCRRAEVEASVSIRDLKRLAADQADILDLEIDCEEAKPEKVAIVGAGPAGLSAAYQLARKGYKSTIFEALPVAGGMLRVGVPDYRLPPSVLEREVEAITRLGVEIKYDSPLGPDLSLDDLFSRDYKAVYLAMGAHRGMDLGIPGEEAEGVVQGVKILKEINLGQKPKLGRKVVVIGGGNVAMDVSRSIRRLGVEDVTIAYRRTRAEMPAWEEEIEAALEEGVKIEFLVAPQEVLAEDGQVKGLRCVRMELGEPDASGRRRPVPIPGSEVDFEADMVVPAIGQVPILDALSGVEGIEISRYGAIEADPVTYETGRPGVFAGGDMMTGPFVAIGAVAAGNEAAKSIVRYLQGEDMKAGREPIDQDMDKNWRDIPAGEKKKPRLEMPKLPVEERLKGFDEVELGFDPELGVAEAARCISCSSCCECFRCVEACEAEAVTCLSHGMGDETLELNVGAVILSPGFDAYDPKALANYHYGDHPNVVTALEFERILASGGPTVGHLARPGDGKEPAKIAFLQCIGSRNLNQDDHGYCSSVCCMYAIKEAIIAKDHSEEPLDCAIFYMDIRTFGKDFERYYEKAKAEGVRFIRARAHSIDPVRSNGNLSIRYITDAGEIAVEEFDMVVLSHGLQISDETAYLADRINVNLNPYHFTEFSPFMPVSTSRPGIYACGVMTGPKDIPQSVMEASAAACAAGMSLNEARGTETKTLYLPEEIDISEQEPRIGVFVCNCGVNISSVVDVPEVAEYAANLPNVVHVEQSLFTCSQDSQDKMKQIIGEQSLNRVVVASCSPRTHEGLFQDTLQACGLNKYLFEMANIRDQDSWVHKDDPALATRKAKDLVSMAVARANFLRPLVEKKIGINKTALVIGGGVAGMNAALGLAKQGFEVVLVEKEAQLGGLARELTTTIEGADIQTYLNGLIREVMAHEKIQVLTESLIVGFQGVQGNFTTELIVGPAMYERKIDHGVVIVATGANEYRPSEYCYGDDERVVTQIELSKRLERMGASDLNEVVMIQCIGSRNEKNPNCSRVCCQSAIKNAIHIKELNPEARVIILNRDMRTYGLLEDYYTEARRLGVIFAHYEPDDPPRVEPSPEGLHVTFKDDILKRDITVKADLLTLSAGFEAEDTEELASILKLARDSSGYFMEAHVKLKPVDMAKDAIFVCGT
ncbi:MAG: FAD-dependent oxidoreductase, partial [Deltaproteobacteria bacterium]|nr:FAD-dependent oxidoreductase [Deltaproteobacteria bacterium]